MPNMLMLLRMAPWVIILGLLAWGARVNDLRDRYSHLWHAEQSGRLADRSAYTSAQKTAQLENEKHVAQENQLRAKIGDVTRSNYLAERDRLRSQANRANQGASHTTATAGVPDASKGADGDGLPFSSAERLQASEIELRLLYLQRWVEEQLGVK